MVDPVTLSAGDLGGETVEGASWPHGEIRSFEFNGRTLNYRRDNGQAVFVGEG